LDSVKVERDSQTLKFHRQDPNKSMRNKGDISDKLWTARRETEIMINAYINQKTNLFTNENKIKKEQLYYIIASAKHLARKDILR